MCGRFTLAVEPETLKTLFDLAAAPELSPRHNIAPTQPVAAVRFDPEHQQRQFTYLTWGLIPSWAQDIKIGARMINARSETAADKPAYRSAFRYRRCLIPADGFYEWQKRKSGKQPYYIALQRHQLFAIAGLWERWQSPDGSVIESCTLLTTTPNELVRPLHNRMPVILAPAAYADWLAPRTPASRLKSLLRPYPADHMIAYPVSTRVNSPAYDTPDCIQPLPSPHP
ncbi:MAG: SOS response-associated peptidase [Chloroflexi bacterium]|nr:SOS response-associated peptidase [Chloroflexota bacterium]